MFALLPPGSVDDSSGANSHGAAHGCRRRRLSGRRVPRGCAANMATTLAGTATARPPSASWRRILAGWIGRPGAHPPRAQRAGSTQSRKAGKIDDPHRYLQRSVFGTGGHFVGLLCL